jgi:hypothetical protein
MSSVPGVTITGTPGASTGSGAVPDSSKPAVPLGPSGSPVSIGPMSSPPSPSSSSSPPEPPLTPASLNGPSQTGPSPAQQSLNQANAFRPKGTPARAFDSSGNIVFVLGGQTKDQLQAQAEQQNIKELGFTPGEQFSNQQEVNAKVAALGINYESQTPNLVNGIITTGGPSVRDIYVSSLIGEVAKGYKGQGFKTSEDYLSNRLQQVGLAYNPQTKTITDPLEAGIIQQQKYNQINGGYAGISFGGGGDYITPNLSYILSNNRLQQNYGQQSLGYISDQYSQEQIKALTQPITEYGNIPNFFDKNGINTSAIPNPALAIIQEPGGPITAKAKELGSTLGQVALGQLVRNSPFEETTKASEAARALVFNPTSALYGNKPELQRPKSVNPTNYSISLHEDLGISAKLSPSLTSTIPVNSPLFARQLVEQSNQNIAVENALSKLTLESDITKFVNTEASKGVKQISIYDLATGSNLGKVQANKFGVDVINEIAKQRQIYLQDYNDPLLASQKLKESNQARNEIVSYIGEAQNLGLKLNLIDKSGKTITVPSESGYHSLIGAEKGGNAISISKAAPQTPQEIANYLQRQNTLMLSNNKNNTEDQNVIDLVRGAISAGEVIGFGLIGTLISLPQNTHAILEKGNPEFYGNNDVFTTLNNLIKPSGIAADIFNKKPLPESVTNDVLSFSIPKESTNYLIGEGLVEGGLVVQQVKEAGSYASALLAKSGPIIKGLVARTFDTNDLITLPNAKAEVSTNPTTRTTGTFKNLNMMRTTIPKDVFGFDTLETPKLSETPKIPENPLLENVSKETQTRNTAIQNKLLEPVPKTINPKIKPIEIDPFYRPSKTTLKLEGVTPPLSDITGTAPITKTISSPNPLDATTANQVPGVTITGTPGASTGGVGVPDILQSKPFNEYIDSLQIPRSSIVEQTRIKPENEVFNFKGSRLETNFGSSSSKDPLGLLRKEKLETSNLIQLDPFYRPGKGLGILSGEIPLEEQAARLAPIESNNPIESTNLSRASRIESEKNLFDIKGQGALRKIETFGQKPVKEDIFYRNNLPMKSLGATNKISKNVARVDIESVLHIDLPVKPDLSDFMNIGKANEFTETNIYLGRGIGFTLNKGEGRIFTRPSPPTDPFKPEEVPKGFKTIESGGTLILQKLEEPKQETLIETIQEQKKRTKQEGDLVKLGTGTTQLVKTKQIIRPKQLEKPKYVLINKPKQKEEGILITIPKQGQKQSEKLDQLLKQKLQPSQTFKQQSDQLLKPLQTQKLEQPQLFKQEEQGKQMEDLLFAPKTLQAQDQKLVQIQTPKTKTKERSKPPGSIFAPSQKPPKKKKLTNKEEAFIGNASDVQIEGLYNRTEVTLGVSKINKLVGKDYERGSREYKSKTRNPFNRKNIKL